MFSLEIIMTSHFQQKGYNSLVPISLYINKNFLDTLALRSFSGWAFLHSGIELFCSFTQRRLAKLNSVSVNFGLYLFEKSKELLEGTA